MICGIGHVAFDVADMQASLRFYCGVLGFVHAFSLRDDGGNPWIEYVRVADRQFIELFYAKQPGTGGKGVSYNHLCLEVDDIQAAAARLRENGIEIFSGPNRGSDGNWQCWARDPDGNRIEFMQLVPSSPQLRG